MNELAARKLDFSRKVLLRATGSVAVVVPIVFGIVTPTPIRAQSQAANTPALAPVYEVASIRLDKSCNGGERIMSDPDGFSATCATVRSLIQEAYGGVEDNQISGAPNWANSEQYDIEAKMDRSVADQLQKHSEEQQKVERDLMLQALLADRFRLSLHRASKELPVYALVIAKNGPKLRQAKPGETYANGLKTAGGRTVGPHMMLMQLGGGQIAGQGVPLESLVKQLSGQLGRTVLDKTGLKGNYDFNLQWTPDASRTPMLKGAEGGRLETAAPPDSGPSIFTAIQEQLGLKLESQKGPVEILVIDHVEKPSGN